MKWVATALILAPVAIGVTVILMPLWLWFETATGVESVGHSGPAEWCYIVIYAACMVAGWIALRHQVRNPE